MKSTFLWRNRVLLTSGVLLIERGDIGREIV